VGRLSAGWLSGLTLGLEPGVAVRLTDEERRQQQSEKGKCNTGHKWHGPQTVRLGQVTSEQRGE
jgi:hypothetical protein